MHSVNGAMHHGTRTGLAHMAGEEHTKPGGRHLECPDRVRVIMQALASEGLAARCTFVECREVELEELHLAHSEQYVEKVSRTERMKSQQEMDAAAKAFSLFDSYFTRGTFKCASAALGGTLELLRGVLTGELDNGFAAIRPPGHHVEYDECRGFGVFNNVAVAAVTARIKYGVDRLLIVDWDVYHGTGTQHLFEDDSSILYFSIHRFDNGAFFPGSKSGSAQSVGRGDAQGLNVNVAWNGGGMGDDEYLAALHCILLPIASEFRPQCILVSAGFTAAAGEQGGCSVSPAGFAQMTQMLMGICPRVLLILEGGYALPVIPPCAAACVRALLGDQLQMKREAVPRQEARVAIEQTLRAQRPHWHALKDSEHVNVMTAQSISLEAMTVPHAVAHAAARGNMHVQNGQQAPQPFPEDVRIALDQMRLLQNKLQLFSQDLSPEEEHEMRQQLEEVSAEIQELMALAHQDSAREMRPRPPSSTTETPRPAVLHHRKSEELDSESKLGLQSRLPGFCCGLR